MVIRLFLLVFVFLFSGIAWADESSELSQEVTNPERPAGVSAAPGVLRLGPMAIHPYLAISEAYSDNIFFTKEGKDHDFITSLAPGLYLELPIGAHTLSFNGNMIYTGYAKYSSQDTTDYSFSEKGNFELGNLFNLKLSDTYMHSHESAGSSATGVIEKFNNNAATASFTYLLADVSKVRLEYSLNSWSYETEPFRSRDEDLVSAYIYYRILPKTSVFLQYAFKDECFYNKSYGLDNKVQSGFLGLFWEPSAKSTVTIKGGYLDKDFDLSSNGSFNTWTGSVDANYYFSDFTSVKLVASRDVNESAVLGTTYYITTGLSGELTQKFLERLLGVARGFYWHDAYSNSIAGQTEARKDQTASAGLGVRYFWLRWLETDLDYNHTNKVSNVSGVNYTENREILSFKAAF
jgi:hypothetical protein